MPPYGTTAVRDGIDVVPESPAWAALRQGKRLLLSAAALGLILSVSFALWLPDKFTSVARLLPPQQKQSGTVALLGQLGSLAQLGGVGMRSPSELYVAMLKSRSVADEIIARFDLRKVYGQETMADTRVKLAAESSLTADKTGVITIKVDDQDPDRAASIANAYSAALIALNQRLAVSEASQRRNFFEQQLGKARDELAKAEGNLRQFKESTGLIQPDGQAGLTVSASATLRAQVTSREVQLAGMRTYATESNPEVIGLQRELEGLRSQLARMDRNASVGKGDVLVAIGKAPEATLEYQRRVRELRYRETLFEVLARQYETARIDEAQDATVVQVLDSATVPEKRSGPWRTLIVLGGTLGVILAVAVGLVMRANASRQGFVAFSGVG